MTLNYKLTNADFLALQLYSSSQSALQNKKRFRSRIIVPILYIVLGLYAMLKNGQTGFGMLFIGLAVAWYLLYPLYSKWKYKKHFEKHVEENYKNRVNQAVEIKIDDEALYGKDFMSETKIIGTEIKNIIETKVHFFLKLVTEVVLIIPKHTVENQDGFKKIIQDFGAEYVDELNWEWK